MQDGGVPYRIVPHYKPGSVVSELYVSLHSLYPDSMKSGQVVMLYHEAHAVMYVLSTHISIISEVLKAQTTKMRVKIRKLLLSQFATCMYTIALCKETSAMREEIIETVATLRQPCAAQ